MRIVITYNPIAGRGRARSTAEQFTRALRDAGHSVVAVEMQPRAAELWLDEQASGADVLVVIGGDGAVRLTAPTASRFNAPLYQVPFGTENLFAREFGMDRHTTTLLRALGRFEIIKVDLGVANAEPFVLMASIGFDAEVVHELAAHRTGAITRLSYARPILRQLRCWRPPTLRITVDEQPLELPGAGSVVIANCRQYGMRLDPSPYASMVDGALDVAYFPMRSWRDVVYWMAAMRFGRHVRDKRVIRAAGKHIVVTMQPQQRLQLDGDAVLHRISSLDIRVVPAALPVLTARCDQPV